MKLEPLFELWQKSMLLQTTKLSWIQASTNALQRE